MKIQEGNLECGAKKCETFSTSLTIEGLLDPDFLNPNNWQNLPEILGGPEVERAIEELSQDIGNFFATTRCPLGCPATQTVDFEFSITPLDQEDRECKGETKIDICRTDSWSVRLANGDFNTACGFAYIAASRRVHQAMNLLARETCGYECGYYVKDLTIDPMIEFNEWGPNLDRALNNCRSVGGLLGKKAEVTVCAKDNLVCTGVSTTNKYQVDIKATACVKCASLPGTEPTKPSTSLPSGIDER